MRKMDFMRYTSIQIVTLCADLYKKQKLKGFIITTEYTNVVIRIKDGFETVEIRFYNTGKIVFRRYFVYGDKADTDYYIWNENTADENVAKKLKRDLKKYLFGEKKETIRYIECEV